MNDSDPSPTPQCPRYTTFSEALDTARHDAESMAREAAPKLKQALAGAAHDLAYGAAFGACFAACFARELIPAGLRESIKRGAKDGSAAATRDAPGTVETAAACPT